MLNISPGSIAKPHADSLKKQKMHLKIISILMLTGGILCIIFPIYAGDMLSIILGILLVLCSTISIAIMFKNRENNFFSLLSCTFIGIAYAVIGCVFIASPESGVLAITAFLACLFGLGGIMRVIQGIRKSRGGTGQLTIITGIIDLIISWCFINASPLASVMMISMIVGIELIFSAFSFIKLAHKISIYH